MLSLITMISSCSPPAPRVVTEPVSAAGAHQLGIAPMHDLFSRHPDFNDFWSHAACSDSTMPAEDAIKFDRFLRLVYQTPDAPLFVRLLESEQALASLVPARAIHSACRFIRQDWSDTKLMSLTIKKKTDTAVSFITTVFVYDRHGALTDAFVAGLSTKSRLIENGFFVSSITEDRSRKVLRLVVVDRETILPTRVSDERPIGFYEISQDGRVSYTAF